MIEKNVLIQNEDLKTNVSGILEPITKEEFLNNEGVCKILEGSGLLGLVRNI